VLRSRPDPRDVAGAADAVPTGPRGGPADLWSVAGAEPGRDRRESDLPMFVLLRLNDLVDDGRRVRALIGWPRTISRAARPASRSAFDLTSRSTPDPLDAVEDPERP
jgi:hypothetical protein